MAADRNPVEKSFSALHDRAFDQGLITFDTDLRLRCATSLRDHYTSEAVAFNFSAYEGRPLNLPTSLTAGRQGRRPEAGVLGVAPEGGVRAVIGSAIPTSSAADP